VRIFQKPSNSHGGTKVFNTLGKYSVSVELLLTAIGTIGAVAASTASLAYWLSRKFAEIEKGFAEIDRRFEEFDKRFNGLAQATRCFSL